jgi:RHS repeat-associated protein
VITDVNGNAVSTHKYLPFGEELSPSSSNSSHKFTGHERDAETGLDYMLARYYSVSHRRFTAVDPGGDVIPEIPPSWNPYAYARQNPIAFVDPDGRAVTYQGSDGAQVTRVQTQIDALCHASNLFAVVYNAHNGTNKPDLTIVVGKTSSPSYSGETDSNITQNGEYVNSTVTIDIENNRWLADLVATLVHELGHVQDYMNNPVVALLEAAKSGPHGSTGHKRLREWIGQVKKDWRSKSGNSGENKERRKGVDVPGAVASQLESQGLSVSIDGGSSNSHMKHGFKSTSVSTSR